MHLLFQIVSDSNNLYYGELKKNPWQNEDALFFFQYFYHINSIEQTFYHEPNNDKWFNLKQYIQNVLIIKNAYELHVQCMSVHVCVRVQYHLMSIKCSNILVDLELLSQVHFHINLADGDIPTPTNALRYTVV